MSQRSSLKEFQEQLARRFAQSDRSDHRTLLGVRSGETNWLVPLAAAGEILPPPKFASVPLTQVWFVGLVNVRGTLYSVADLSAFHGGPASRTSGGARLLLAGAKLGNHCALLVDAALGLRSPDDFETVSALPQVGRPWDIAHLRDSQGVSWHLLEVARLFAHPGFLNVGIE